MKQVVAIVKPYLVEKVLEGLKRAPLAMLVIWWLLSLLLGLRCSSWGCA